MDNRKQRPILTLGHEPTDIDNTHTHKQINRHLREGQDAPEKDITGAPRERQTGFPPWHLCGMTLYKGQQNMEAVSVQ